MKKNQIELIIKTHAAEAEINPMQLFQNPLPNKSRKLSGVRCLIVADLFHQGMAICDIAKLFGIKWSLVWYYIKRAKCDYTPNHCGNINKISINTETIDAVNR